MTTLAAAVSTAVVVVVVVAVANQLCVVLAVRKTAPTADTGWECQSAQTKPKQINNPCENKLAVNTETETKSERKEEKESGYEEKKVSPVETFLIEFYDTHLLWWRWGIRRRYIGRTQWMEVHTHTQTHTLDCEDLCDDIRTRHIIIQNAPPSIRMCREA